MNIEYEKLEKIVLLFWDDEDNFKLEKTKQKIGTLFQKIHPINNFISFEDAINQYKDSSQQFLCFVHLAHSKQNKGYDDFINSKILKEYPNLRFYLITSALKNQVYDKKNESLDVYTYDGYQEKIFTTFIPQRKDEIINQGIINTEFINPSASISYPQIKYAIITALYKDEFEELKKIFDFPEDKQIATKKKIFYRGYLKSDKNIEIVAAIPNSTGMVDSSIIATQLLEFFRPKYLLMSGVCGSSKDLNFGDIIVAKQIFTFQKGKISDLKRKNEKGEFVKIDLFDSNKELIDYDNLYDNDGHQISISIEKFEVEHDTIIPLDSLFEDSLNPKLEIIKNKINDKIKNDAFFDKKLDIKIVIEPMACSTMVINKEGYFEDMIKSVHRKTAAVEMESYGVARACQFANNGKTVPIIFKSVMDKTSDKFDYIDGINYKKFAAFTSALFLKYLFDENVI